MTRYDHDAWRDYPSGADQDSCIVCGKPTTSHAIYLSDVDGRFEAGSPDDHDFLFPVCHTCYRKYDGDAGRVAGVVTEDRSEMLDAMGITPKVVGDLTQMNDLEQTERIKVLGEAGIEEMIEELEPGDVFEVNGDMRWVVIPAAKTDEVQGEVIAPLFCLDEDTAGGFCRSQHPTDDRVHIAYQDLEYDQLAFEPVTELEFIGRKDVDFEHTDLQP